MDGTPMTVEQVLVPVDGSDEAVTAAEYAIAIAATYGAAVHVMYVLGEEISRAMDMGTLDSAEVAEENQAVFDTISERAESASVSVGFSTAHGFSSRRKLVHPGSVILDTAEQIDADFLVIPRESQHDDSADVLEKAAEYVLLYASQPVLSV